MLIFFEGVDKTGKTTLVKEVLRKTNYKHVVYDRGVISQVVYDFVFDRDPDPAIKEAMTYLKKANAIIFLCEAKNELIEKRLNEANETLPKELSDIGRIKRYFRAAVIGSGIKYKVIKTDKPLDETVEEILDNIKEAQNGNQKARNE